MPVYAYKCDNCGYYFEEKQSFSDDPITDCPNCDHEQTVHRVIQPVGVVFKGSGFYVTDNRGSANSAAPASVNGDDSAKTDTGDSSSDAKPAASASDSGEKKAEKKESKPATSKPESSSTKPASSD